MKLKTLNKKLKALALAENCYEYEDQEELCGFDFSADLVGPDVCITCQQMYDYPTTLKLALFLVNKIGIDVDSIHTNQWHTDGCHTCDFGSVYSIEIRFPFSELKKVKS